MTKIAFEAMRKKLEDQDPFLKDANLDTRGLPGFLHAQATEESFIDDRFGGMVAENRESLRQSIGALVGSNDAEVNAVLERAGIQNPYAPSTVHVGENQFHVYYKDGSWRGKGVFNGELHRFTGNDRDTVIGKIMDLAKREPAIRELTEEEKLQVIRAAQSGDRLTAIGTYLRFVIGDARAAQYDSPIEMMADPKLVPIMDECCDFCWFHCNPHAIDTEEWHEYKNRILAGRPATFQLLDAIWLRYQDFVERQDQSNSQQTEPEPPDPRDIQASLEDADDETINKTFWSTLKHAARSGR